MLTDADRDAMRADLLQVRDERPAVITIRRGSGTLAAQTVRIERISRGRARASDQGRERRADIIILGDVDLDIQTNDRFTHEGVLYEVIFVPVNRDFAVMAEAAAVE